MNLASLNIDWFAILLLIIIAILGAKYYITKKNQIPKLGETRNGRIYVSLEDPIFDKVNAQKSVSLVKQKILNQFNDQAKLIIGIRYYAISNDGRRFLVRIESESSSQELWIQPSEVQKQYIVNTSMKKKNTTSMKKKIK